MGSLAAPTGQIGSLDRPTTRTVLLGLTVAAAFGVYWLSSFILEASGWPAMTKFSADTGYYSVLAEGQIYHRSARFHPVTVALALAWMKFFDPLTLWIAPVHLLKAMFAAIGALGVAAAMWAFTAVVPRRHVLVCGLIYASSLGVWYFSSIEESKIVTASLSVFYIAVYLHLRDQWTRGEAALLTAILLLACLNEIVAGFLIIIPIVDTLIRRGWDWRHGWWIAVHGLVGPIALAILEFVVKGAFVNGSADPEQASLVSHLLYYLSQNDYSATRLYSFVVNWLFFNIAAPSPTADYWAGFYQSRDAWHVQNYYYSGEFNPALANYLTSPLSAGVAVLFGVMIVAIVLRRYRPVTLGNSAGIPSALMAYAFVRGAFFMIYLPGEPLVNSASTSLAHLLIVIIPFTASRFPAKQTVLVAFAVLLFLSNGMFFISQ
jgi:hypothetical protein